MRPTFRKKALLFIIPILILISAIHTYDAIKTEKVIMRTEIIKRAEAITTLATKTGELPILSGNPELLKTTASFLREKSGVTSVAFYDNKMNLLIQDGAPVSKQSPFLSLNTPISMFDEPDVFAFFSPVFTVRAGEDIDIFQEGSQARQIRENIGWVRLGFSKSGMKAAERKIVLRGFLLAAIFTIGSSILAFIIVTITTKPLSMLLSAAKKLEKGEYPETKVVSSRDEIGELASAFYRMSGAIKDRETRLAESGKKIIELFDRVEHAIFRLDGEGNIVETNRKFDELCNGTKEFCSLFTDKREGVRLQKAISNELKNSEEKIIDGKGNEHVVILSIYPEFDKNSNIIGFDGYFVDVTEKKRLEETLIQAQKLESIGLLAGGIAHDFNNILTGILGYSSLLKSQVEEDDKMYRYLDTIEKSALRATNLTHQLLGFARRGKYQMENLSVNDIVKELIQFLRETFDRNITIVVDAEENLPPVTGDGNQLYQALMNLCINARDAMPDGGRLYIKTEFYLLRDAETVDFFNLPAGEYVRISITDTGCGMTPEVKNRIFEPFYTTKGIGKGTGLGLSMVYGIIKNHGGHINAYSEVGLGTTMRIYLPSSEGAVEEKRRDYVMDDTRKKGTILFIDDEDIVRELGKDILEAYNYNVILATHGNEGVRIFNDHKDHIDLVILDMVMPEKSGKQVFKEIRSIKGNAKVLLCSGFGQEQYFHELFETGAAGFLQKPFQHVELIGKVEEAMEK